MKVHVLGLPHTQTTEEFTTCAFTQKAFNLCKMLHRRGHHVIHYGVEGSNPECSERVDVMSAKQWEKEIGRPGTAYYNISTEGKLAPYHALFAKNMHAALAARTGAPDTEIVCQTWGGAQVTACAGIEQHMVESGIGYPISWAEWRVYESYAWMHMHLGRDQLFGGKKWYWRVIPNAFDLKNFRAPPYGPRGEDFLYLGRLNDDKGVGIAIQVAKEVGRNIVIVGQGDPQPFLAGNPHARYMKPVGVEKRRELLANARAVFCLTQFVEPFCGVNVEAQLSGTPVITSDHGVFSETVLHGVTGYRGSTFEQWVWAAKNIDRINGNVCREWAEANYSIERVALMYEEFFQQVLNVRNNRGQKVVGPTGFYERHPGRTQLDWLVRKYPQAAVDSVIDLTRPHEAPVVEETEPAAGDARPAISFVMRVHNDEKTLEESLSSLLQLAIPIEVVVVLHRCTDGSATIASACKDSAPPRHRLRIVEYDTPVSRAGLETFVTPSTSPYSISSYVTYAFDLASCDWKFKWDSDYVATPQFRQWIEQKDWASLAPKVIRMNHRSLDGIVCREPFAHNCLRGFGKQHFWEVPVFPAEDDFVYEEAPDEAAFVHASTQDTVKPYWRDPPWFAAEEQATEERAAEAATLRRRYAQAVELLGPEPVGLARSNNPEADAYLQRCLAVRDALFGEELDTWSERKKDRSTRMLSNLITVCITSCGRPDLLEKTLDSFFTLARGHALRVLISEDMAAPEQCDGLVARYGPGVTVFRNEPRMGQVGAIDMLYSRVDTPYIFHCEDDWLFDGNTNFLEESLDVLEDQQQLVHQIGLREHDGKFCGGLLVGAPRVTRKSVEYRLIVPSNGWSGFSWNPGLRRIADYKRMFPGGYSAFKQHKEPAGPFEGSGEVELRCSVHAQSLGYRAAILERPACHHIGAAATDHKA